MRPKTEATTNQTAAQTNKTITGTRHDASIAAGGATEPERGAGETACADEEVAFIKKRRSGLFQLAPSRIALNSSRPGRQRERSAGILACKLRRHHGRRSSPPGRAALRTCSHGR